MSGISVSVAGIGGRPHEGEGSDTRNMAQHCRARSRVAPQSSSGITGRARRDLDSNGQGSYAGQLADGRRCHDPFVDGVELARQSHDAIRDDHAESLGQRAQESSQYIPDVVVKCDV